jgi:tetratricopeptide (TPR) repeat protein
VCTPLFEQEISCLICEKQFGGPERLTRLFGALLIAFLILIAAAPASAQTTSASSVPQTPEALAARQASLLQVMLASPEDLDTAFEYAMVSSLLGDYEAAVSTLERMLIYAPGVPRIQLELGVLYFRLGSIETSRYYFQEALNAPNVPKEVEARVHAYMETLSKQDDPASFRASVVTGVRYQTNANAAPGSRRVDLNGGTFLLDDTATGKADVNAFLAGRAHGSYDLGLQGDLFETDFIFYGARYADIVRLDTALAELTLGPSLNLERFNLDDTRLGLYAIASGIRLNHANYNGALGFGARLVSQIIPTVFVDSKIEYRRRWYNDTAEYPTVSDRNGSFLRLATTISRKVSQAITLRTLILADFEETKQVWTQSWEAGGGIGGTIQFASPIKQLQHPWSLDLEAGYIYREYQGPDPLVDPTVSQFDHEGWMRAGLSVPLRNDLALGFTGEFRRQYSNYDLGTYSNASALVSLTKAF